jgi:hypothetical protein
MGSILLADSLEDYSSECKLVILLFGIQPLNETPPLASLVEC